MLEARVCDKKVCTGCGACVNVCPNKCIELKVDKYGATYPFIDSNICTSCGLCKKVCVQNNPIPKSLPIKTYASYLKDFNERLDSASGGVAKSLYMNWLKQNDAYIVGVYFNDLGKAKFLITNNLDDISKFQGSKYVQADTEDLHIQILELLNANKKILLIGMPCQIASVIKFLEIKKAKIENLLTVDLLCHGVSPQQYLDESISRFKLASIDNIIFRSNRRYKSFHFVLYGKKRNGKNFVYNKYAYEDPYFYGFLKGISLRESCYNCQFSTSKRVSDITIGDFIGLANKIPFEGNKINASVILCNTSKGLDYTKTINELHLFERKFSEAYEGGVSLQAPFPRHKLRDKFLKKYKNGQFYNVMYKVAFWDLLQYSLKVLHKHIWVHFFMKDLLKKD